MLKATGAISQLQAEKGHHLVPRCSLVLNMWFRARVAKAETGQELSHWLRYEGQRRLDSERE